MNFKNVRVLNLPGDFAFPEIEALEEKLFERAFVECGKHQHQSTGFISPFGMQSDVLAHPVGKNVLLKVRVEEKILPAAAINAELERKEQAYIEQHGEAMSKKQRVAVKLEIAEQMLPTAFTKFKDTDLYLDLASNRIVVGVGSQKAAEDITGLLRSALGSLPSNHWMGEHTGSVIFTSWLLDNDSVPGEFYLGGDADFRGAGDDDSKHTIKNDELTSDEVKALINNGKECVKISLDLPGHATFNLDESLGIKSIKMADVVMDNADDADDSKAAVDVDFALWSGEINHIINTLEKAINSSANEKAA